MSQILNVREMPYAAVSIATVIKEENPYLLAGNLDDVTSESPFIHGSGIKIVINIIIF